MRRTPSKRKLSIAGTTVLPGERKNVSLNVAKLYDLTPISIPIEVIRGKEEGPVLFLTGAIHGDEIIGPEIIRRVLNKRALSEIKGTLIAVPIVNIYGYNAKSRYLPDRRDLNRSFPGRKDGALASQISHLLMKEVVSKSTHGIDFHSGAIHRSNLPQIRASLDDRATKKMALNFGVSVVIDSRVRDGSLRDAVRKMKIPVLLFEGGEALRFDESAIRKGVNGTFKIMRSIGMLPPIKSPPHHSFIARDSSWVRAPHSGMVTQDVKLGKKVTRGEVLAVISDPFGNVSIPIVSKLSGVVIGRTELPLVNRGDAMFHIATLRPSGQKKKPFLEDVEFLAEE